MPGAPSQRLPSWAPSSRCWVYLPANIGPNYQGLVRQPFDARTGRPTTGWAGAVTTRIRSACSGLLFERRNPHRCKESVAGGCGADRVLGGDRRSRVLRQACSSLRAETRRDSIVVASPSVLALVPGVRGSAPPSAPDCSRHRSANWRRVSASFWRFRRRSPRDRFRRPMRSIRSGTARVPPAGAASVSTVIEVVVGFAAIAWFLKFLVSAQHVLVRGATVWCWVWWCWPCWVPGWSQVQ